MYWKISIIYLRNIKFLIISGASIFVFLLLGHLFVSGMQDFDILVIILYILLLWIGCALISHVLNKNYTWQKHTLIRLLLHSSGILLLTISVVFFLDVFPSIINKKDIIYDEVKLNVVVTFLVCITVSAIAETRDVIIVWKETLIRTKQLEKENIQAQFIALKNQVNPHFLFNSLNTLANFVQEIPQADEYVKNLSEFLRFTLTIKEDLVISIEEELHIVSKYVYLQQARFKGNLHVNIDIPQEVIKLGYVPPFSIQMIVENAIKHNVISKSKPLSIRIYMQKDYLHIENNLQKKEIMGSTQMGLKNIMERYRIISDKQVAVENSDFVFRVLLPVIYNK